jgi:hypothetical protein
MTVKFERDRRREIEHKIEVGRWQRRAVHAEKLIQQLFEEIAQLKAEIAQHRLAKTKYSVFNG